MHALPSMNSFCCKRPNYDFCISQGSVATVLKWGRQNHSHLRQVSSWCSMPKIIQPKSANVSRSYSKHNPGTVFLLRHGVYRLLYTTVYTCRCLVSCCRAFWRWIYASNINLSNNDCRLPSQLRYSVRYLHSWEYIYCQQITSFIMRPS